MSLEIFKWAPHLIDFGGKSIKWDVIKSEFENGTEQRRLRSGREKGRWRFVYHMHQFSTQDLLRLEDYVFDFWNRMKGSYDNFFLPSWEYEAKVSSVSGKTVNVTLATALGGTLSKVGFTATRGQQGNFVFITNRFGSVCEVGQIDTVSSNSMVLTYNVVNPSSYNSRSYVMKAYRVRFAMDELERDWKTPHAWEKELEFVEDIGA